MLFKKVKNVLLEAESINKSMYMKTFGKQRFFVTKIDNNEALKKDNERLGKQILDLQNTLLQEQRDHSQKLQGLNDMLTAKIKNAYLIGGTGVVLSIVLAGFLFTK